MTIELPLEVRVAIKVILNHVEPGWENCKALVNLWLEENPVEIKPK